MRYRLVPARQRAAARWVEGDESTARAAAEHDSVLFQMPVLVCAAPEGGVIRQLFMVGQDPALPVRR